MRIPEKPEVDGVKWSIIRAALASDRFGETKADKCQVLLAEDVDPQMQELTYWHELLHMLCATRDIEFHGETREEREEDVVRQLGPALHAFMLQNATVIWKPHCFPQDGV